MFILCYFKSVKNTLCNANPLYPSSESAPTKEKTCEKKQKQGSLERRSMIMTQQ